jgi:hypothetical protein
MPPKLTQEQAEAKVKSVKNGEYELNSRYEKASGAVELRHGPCGGIIRVTFKGFTDEGKGQCRTCTSRTRPDREPHLTESSIVKKLESREIEYVEGLTRSHAKASFRCRICSNTFTARPHDVLRGSNCPRCAGERRGSHLRGLDVLGNALRSAGFDSDYEWLEGYSGSNKDKHLIRHKKCAREYRTRPNDVQQGYGCPFCSDRFISNNFKKLMAALGDAEVRFEREMTFPDCVSSSGNPLRFDIWVPEFSILVEYDGEQHFGRTSAYTNYFSEESSRKTKINDRIKNSWVEKHAVSLLRLHYMVSGPLICKVVRAIADNNLEALERLARSFTLWFSRLDRDYVVCEEEYYELGTVEQ